MTYNAKETSRHASTKTKIHQVTAIHITRCSLPLIGSQYAHDQWNMYYMWLYILWHFITQVKYYSIRRIIVYWSLEYYVQGQIWGRKFGKMYLKRIVYYMYCRVFFAENGFGNHTGNCHQRIDQQETWLLRIRFWNLRTCTLSEINTDFLSFFYFARSLK